MIKQGRTIILFIIILFSLLKTSVSFAQATQDKNILLDSLKHSDKGIEKINLLNTVAMFFYENEDMDSAFFYSSEELKLAINEKYSKGIMNAYYTLGLVYKGKDEYIKSNYNLEKALQVSMDTKDDEISAKIYNGIAEILINKGEFILALENCYKSLKISENRNDKKGIANSLKLIGTIYWNQGNYNLALDHNNKALKIFEEIHDKKGIAASLNAIGIIYKIKKEYLLALDYYEKALVIRTEIGDKYGEARTLGNIANVYVIQGDYNKAIGFYSKSLKIKQEKNDKLGILSGSLNLGDTYIDMKEYAIAEQYLNTALDITNEIGVMHFKKEIYNSFSKLYAAQKKFEKAYYYQKLNTEIRDTLFNVDRTKQIAEIQTKYETEKNENKIELLDKENKVKEARLTKKQFQTNVLIIGVVVVLIFSFVLYKKQKSQKRANIQLEAQKGIIEKSNQEKEVLLKEVHHRVKNNLQIISSLLNLQSRKVKDPNVAEALKDGRNRVKAMALIHQKLYMKENFGKVDLKDYLEGICENLFQSYGDPDQVKLKFDIHSVQLNVDRSIFLGLIVNEVITNALKYAFTERESGWIRIGLNEKDENIELVVKDNGIGMPTDFNMKNPEKFGLQLVKTFVQKLNGTLNVFILEGTTIHIVFPKTTSIENKTDEND